MSEGEFKKQILKLNENGMWGENEYSLSAHNVFEILDEARKDIFSAIHVEEGIDTRRTDIEPAKLLSKLEKWFGDQ